MGMEQVVIEAVSEGDAAEQLRVLVESVATDNMRVIVERAFEGGVLAAVEVDKQFDVEWSMFPAYADGTTGDTWTNEEHAGVWYVTAWDTPTKVKRLRLLVERSARMIEERAA